MLPLADKVTFTGYLRRSLPSVPPNAGEHELPRRAVHPGHHRRRRRRRGADRLGAARLRDRSRHPASGAGGVRPVHAPRAAARVPGARGAAAARSMRSPSRAASSGCWSARVGVVAMGGYNTFCEILSFGKPALLVPRTGPARSSRCAPSARRSWAWCSMLADDGMRAPRRDGRARCARCRAGRRRRSRRYPALLDGLERIAERGGALARAPSRRRRLPRSPERLA